MKLSLEVNSRVKHSFAASYFRKIALKTLSLSKVKRNLNISLAVVSEEEIRKINKIYRKKNQATDVLSFSDGKNFCELVVCYPYIKKSAESRGISLKEEIAYVVSHGILHCLGMKHGKKMYNIQDRVCEGKFIIKDKITK